MTETQRERPLVSVVITAYHDERTVAAAIESALAQDYAPTEVVVVLDGPKDGTAAVVRAYADRVRIIEKENGGTSSARNRGLAEARGAWIQFLDADDVLLPTKVSASLAALERSPCRADVGLIFTGYFRIDAAGKVLATHYAEEYSREKLLRVPGHVTPNPMLRRDWLLALGGYAGRYIYAEDTELYHRLGLTKAMLGVREPHFLYRVSDTQKTRVMRAHEQGNLLVLEPERIRREYDELFAQVTPPWMHPVGELSRRGVLEVGLKCTHSCKFCYYSFHDGSTDQFAGMRRATMRSFDECKQILQGMAAAGLTHFDITGGEPTIHREIVDIVRYGLDELGLRARIITLGQFLLRPMGKGRKLLLDELLEAGLDDFLLSVHAVDPALFQETTGESFEKLSQVMDVLDARGFSYGSNTLVYQHNYRHLPEIAQHLIRRRVRISNFIVMNTYFRWNEDQRMLGVQARYREVKPYLEHAARILEDAGVAVNVRYGPLCAYRGLEKHFVGVLGVELDPYEWRTTLRTGQVKEHRSVAEYLEHQRAQLADAGSMFTKSYGRKCEGCAVRPICDGVDVKYAAQYGWDEFDPYPLAPGQGPVTDPMAFRAQNPRAFVVKNEGASRRELGLVASPAGLRLLAQQSFPPTVEQRLGRGDLEGAARELEQRLVGPEAPRETYPQLLAIYKELDAAEAVDRLEACLCGRDDLPTSAILLFRARVARGLVGQVPKALTVLERVDAAESDGGAETRASLSS